MFFFYRRATYVTRGVARSERVAARASAFRLQAYACLVYVGINFNFTNSTRRVNGFVHVYYQVLKERWVTIRHRFAGRESRATARAGRQCR